MTDANIRTLVLVTANVDGNGDPVWGPDSNATQVPLGQTDVAIENLVAGSTYWVKTWNEDQWGNKSNELITSIVTDAPKRTQYLNFSANGFFDSGSAMSCYFKIPVGSTVEIEQVLATVAFREFQAMATAAASSGTLTSVSSGTLTSASGGGSTSGGGGNHSHSVGVWQSNTPDGTYTSKKYIDGGNTMAFNLTTNGSVDIASSITSTHTHTTPNHTHDIAGHTHDVAGHTHDLTYGTYEETYPASHSVAMRIYHRDPTGWTLKATISGFTADIQDVDITSYFDSTGDWKITLLSAGGTPQGGRLGCDIFGTVTVTI